MRQECSASSSQQLPTPACVCVCVFGEVGREWGSICRSGGCTCVCVCVGRGSCLFEVLFPPQVGVHLKNNTTHTHTHTHTHRYTFEMAPVFSLMESQVLQKMRELIGWRCGDGLFSPGGSISNLYAFMAARYHRFPETKTKGISSLPQMTIFASEQVWEYTASFPYH